MMKIEQPDLFNTATQLTTLPDIAGEPPAQNVDTSLAAADRIKKLPKTKFSEAVLHQWLTERAGYGSTDDEIKEYFGWSGDYERPRRWTLVKQGLVRQSNQRRKSRSGNPMVVWEIV